AEPRRVSQIQSQPRGGWWWSRAGERTTEASGYPLPPPSASLERSAGRSMTSTSPHFPTFTKLVVKRGDLPLPPFPRFLEPGGWASPPSPPAGKGGSRARRASTWALRADAADPSPLLPCPPLPLLATSMDENDLGEKTKNDALHEGKQREGKGAPANKWHDPWACSTEDPEIGGLLSKAHHV